MDLEQHHTESEVDGHSSSSSVPESCFDAGWRTPPCNDEVTITPTSVEVLPADDFPSSNQPKRCLDTKSDGSPCPNFAVKGEAIQKCAAHMKKHLSPGRPVTTAAFSKHLPERLRERMEQFENDPNYVSLRGQIAVVTTRLSDLLERIGLRDSRQRRKDIVEEMDSLVALMDAGLLPAEDLLEFDPDEEDPRAVLIRACRVIRAGRSIRAKVLDLQRQARDEVREDEAWDDVDKFSESLRKLKETEVKRMVAANQVLTVTESYNLIARLVSIIEEYLADKGLRAKAVRELYNLLDRKGSK